MYHPSISFDYKLSMLPASVAIAAPEILLSEEDKKRPSSSVDIGFSLAYSSMLYSYTNKPEILQDNFPALLLILIICTIFSCMKSSKQARNSIVDSKTETQRTALSRFATSCALELGNYVISKHLLVTIHP